MRTVLCAEGLYEPTVGIAHYLERFPATADDPVELLFGVRRTPVPASITGTPHVKLASFIPGRGLPRHEHVDYRRYSYSQVCNSLLRGELRLDAVVAVAGPPLSNRRRSLGVIDGYLQLAIDRARIIVAEERDGVPHLTGAATVDADCAVVSASVEDAFTPLSGVPDATSARIAERIAELIPPRPTIALGVGRILDALTDRLTQMTHLRIVSGAITDAAAALDAVGALDSSAPVEGMSLVGSDDLVSWAADDGRVRLRPSTRIHDPSWLAAHPRFICALGALSVDLAGNVNSERIGDRVVSGLGGAPDLAAGAHGSAGGLCIVALPSMDPSGRSTLKETLPAVSVDGSLVDAIVTEKGVALRTETAGEWRHAIERIF
jgi:acyl-CoA hydrolase